MNESVPWQTHRLRPCVELVRLRFRICWLMDNKCKQKAINVPLERRLKEIIGLDLRRFHNNLLPFPPWRSLSLEMAAAEASSAVALKPVSLVLCVYIWSPTAKESPQNTPICYVTIIDLPVGQHISLRKSPHGLYALICTSIDGVCETLFCEITPIINTL